MQNRIAIFDDHPVLSMGLQSFLEMEGGFHVKVIAETLEELMEALEDEPVDVLIADVVAPGVEGLTLFKTMHTRFPNIKVIAYTTLSNNSLIKQLLLLGVKAYVHKRESPERLRAAVLAVLEGKTALPEKYRHLAGIKPELNAPVSLTQKEMQVLDMICKGKLSKEIGEELQISVNTVRVHRSHLFQKLQVQNVGELIQEAYRLGLSEAGIQEDLNG